MLERSARTGRTIWELRERSVDDEDVKMSMNAETLVKLIEEMIDLKVQQIAQPHHKLSPEVARMLEQKRFTDRQRLQQIRTELTHLLGDCVAQGSVAGMLTGRR